MSDDVCPECQAVESFDDGRCTECGHGVCHGCYSEPVLIDRTRHHCEECGGRDFCDICGRPIPMDRIYPLCTRCEATARHPACGPPDLSAENYAEMRRLKR